MSDSSIMSVREMIDTCFGEPDVNIVNFKLMQTILYLLARQQRLLERRVAIEFGPVLGPRTSSLSVTELKIKATVPKKRQKQITKVTDATKTVPLMSKAKSKESKTSKSTDGTTATKSTLEPTTIDKTSSKFNTTIDKTTSSKSTTEESTADKRILKTPRSLRDKIYSDSTTYEKKTAEPSASEKTTDKFSKDKTKISKSSANEWTEDKIYSKTSKALKSVTDESTEETTHSQSSKDKTKGSNKQRDYHHLLEFIEQQREQELRVVNQRADSREVAEKTPTPMASLDSMEVQFEKLLVVERVPVEEVEKRIGHLQDRKSLKLNVVSQNQFDELAEIVKQMQLKLGLVDKEDFVENMRLLQDLRQSSSLTDAMAAVNLSARLELLEKSLSLMENMLTKLAAKKGIKVTQSHDEKVRTYAVQAAQISVEAPETKVLYDAPKGTFKSAGGTKQTPIIQLTEEPLEAEDPVAEILKENPKGNNIDFDELE